jgi:hypothetical protein
MSYFSGIISLDEHSEYEIYMNGVFLDVTVARPAETL